MCFLANSKTQKYAALHEASPSSVPSASKVFKWPNNLPGNSGVRYIKVETKNKTKCNEKLIARVKAMVDENARKTI